MNPVVDSAFTLGAPDSVSWMPPATNWYAIAPPMPPIFVTFVTCAMSSGLTSPAWMSPNGTTAVNVIAGWRFTIVTTVSIVDSETSAFAVALELVTGPSEPPSTTVPSGIDAGSGV